MLDGVGNDGTGEPAVHRDCSLDTLAILDIIGEVVLLREV